MTSLERRSALLGFALAIATAAPVSAQEPTLGLAAIDLQNSFFVRMKEAGDVAAADYGVRTTWQSAESSLEKQVAIIENFINQKVDAILVDPLDKNALIPVIEKAKGAGIPVVTMGNKVETDWNYNTLYPDYENMAVVARALGHAVGGGGEVALLVGTRGNFVSDTRERGFLETLEKEFPEITVVGVQPTGWDSSKSVDAAQTWLTTYPDLTGMACISDSLCLATHTIAEAMGRQLTYAGYDGDAEMHPLIESGAMVLDVLTGAYRVGYWNIAVAARLAKGEQMSKDLLMPTYFVTSDATAGQLAEKGLKLDHITPTEAEVEAKAYTQQLGPSQPTAAMTVGD